MIAPALPLIVLLGVLALIGLASALLSPVIPLWQGALALILGVALSDLWLCRRRPKLQVERSVHHSLPVAAWTGVELTLTNHSSRNLRLLVYDMHQLEARARGLPRLLVLVAGQRASCHYELFPHERGRFDLPGIDCVIDSPLRLWRRKWFYPCHDEVMVFPNFREIGAYTLLATQHRLSQMGIKQLVRRGAGKEFHQLREYRQGDSLQTIDWNATSRHLKLISKDYQDERDQQVVFVLDSGRRMSHREADTSHLDQALSSILLLAYVASRQGDSVGLYCFGATSKWHPPRKEGGSIRSLLLAAYDIQSGPESADFLRAARELLTCQRRRALMVVVTNSRSEDHDDLLHLLAQLRRRHLVVVADVREAVLDEHLHRPIACFDEALRYQALQHYLAERRRLLKQCSHLGVLSLDVTARQLPAALVNRYLEIKRAGVL